MKKLLSMLARSLDQCIDALGMDLDWLVFEEAPFFNELLPAVLPFFMAEFLLKSFCPH
jgi:hypothetical protein